MSQSTIGVNLKFSADISAAKRSMSELQSSLAQINSISATSANPGIKMSQDLHQASQAAAQLRVQLQSAFNQDTGKLNLTKFNMEMKNAGMSLEQYRAKLMAVGPQGQQAFAQLAQTIAIADTQTVSLSAGIQRLGATFMNTLRYQISSAAIMAVVQGLSEAVDYVKELNTSLNNIRIVTGYGADEMEKFAVQANKAAKALSTTTTAMTDASLIYFQQGLNMQEAQKRAEVTVKLANVTGEAVETVSDQLTAVWNNFYDGSQSLEYYADVLTALGAATASSSEEISEGLEKFAAVANTVGLSYEYATAALATVTATTRQSADVVGTAFKTLFARIQDLELGNTLEDGVTLGQYSEGLAAIGVNILDANGNLKDMNDILNEMGAKWDTLSKAQQVSLAQTVAGVRQYTQLIALMDNWSYFQENLAVVQSSTGELQAQQDIYAESWEAASQRVTAALETIYQKLLDDDAFIGMFNTLADFIELISNVMDGLGGLPGVLALVGAALMRVFSSQMAAGINNVATGIRSLTPAGKAANAQLQQNAAAMAAKEYGTSGAGGQQGVLAREEADLQITYIKNKEKMSEMERKVLEIRMKEVDAQKQILNGELQETKALEQQVAVQQKSAKQLMSDKTALEKRRIGASSKKTIDAAMNGVAPDENGQGGRAKNAYLQGGTYVRANGKGSEYGYVMMDDAQQQKAFTALRGSSAASQINQQALDIKGEDTFAAIAQGSTASTEQQIKAIDEFKSRLESLGMTAEGADAQLADVVGPELVPEFNKLGDAVRKADEEIAKLTKESDGSEAAQKKLDAAVQKHAAAIREAQDDLERRTNEMSEQSSEALRLAGATKESIQATKDAGNTAGTHQTKIMGVRQQYKGLKNDVDQAKIKVLDFGQAMQQAAMMVSTLTMVASSLVGLFKTLGDESMSAGDKVMTVMTTIGFMLPMIIGLFNEQSKSLFLTAAAGLAAAGGQQGAGDAARESGFKALQGKAMWDGFLKTMGKVAIYAVAIAAIVVVVKALADAADDAKNKTANAAAAASKGAKDAAEAFSKATEAYNKLKQTASEYDEAVVGLSKLTKGTDEYTDALFSANEKAMELLKTNKDLKYYVDSNGLIVIDQDSLAAAKQASLEEKASAYSTKLAAEANSRDAYVEVDKQALGQKLKGTDAEWNDEDRASTRTRAAVGAGVVGTVGALGTAATISALAAGGKIGASVGTAFGGPLGTLVGAAAGLLVGGLVGALSGAIASHFGNDATKEEKKALDALAKAYDKQGESALTKDNMRAILAEEGIYDEALIDSLLANKTATKELMETMKKNNQLRLAEQRSAAAQQAQAIDQNLQYSSSAIQGAVNEALTRARVNAEENTSVNIENYRDKRWHGMWVNAKWQGEEAAKAWAQAKGYKDFETTNFSDDYIEYNYIDEEGNRQEKQLTYAELAAWETSQQVDATGKAAYNGIKEAIMELGGADEDKGMLSIIGGGDLSSLSETQLLAFANAVKDGEYNDYINKYAKQLGYESSAEFLKAITDGIESWDYDTALTKFRTQMDTEIDGILSAGAQETGYTTGALENYTKSLQKNTKGLSENADAWEELEDKKLAAQAAVANAKLVKGIEGLNKVLSDNIDTLIKWDETSLDTWEAADNVQTALEGVFGLRVSADFIKNNLKDIQDLAQGSTENLEELSRAAAEDFALNLDTASEENRNWFATLLNQFATMAEETEIGMSVDLDDEEYINRLNEMLEAGEITAEQVQSAFGALGYSPDIKMKTVPQTTTTEHYIFDDPTAKTDDLSKASRKVVNVTKSEIQVPYIAGENTYEAPDIDAGTSGQENGSGFTRTRDIGSVNASVSDLQKAPDNYEKDLERYHEVNEILDDLEREYSAISKAKNRAFGNAHLQAINDEINKTNELITANQRLKREAEAYLAIDSAKLAKYGAQFDESGRITNYEEIRETYAKWYREEMSKNLGEDTKQKTEDFWQEFLDDTAQYEKTLNKLESVKDNLIDKENQAFDLILEAIDYQVTTNTEIIDSKIERLDYQIEHLYDTATKGAKAIELIAQKTEQTINKSKEYTDGIELVLGSVLNVDERAVLSETLQNGNFDAIVQLMEGKNLTTGQLEQLQTYLDGLQGINDDLDSYFKEYLETMSNYLKEWNNEFDRVGNNIDFLTSTLETYQNIIDLVGRKNLGLSYSYMNQLSQQQVKNSIAATKAAKEQLDINEQALEKMKQMRQEQLDSAQDDEERAKIESYWKDTIQHAEDQVQELKGEVQSAWTEALTAASEAFETSINLAAEAFEEAMSGIAGNFENLQTMFDQISTANERYLSDYEKIYQLSKLNRDIVKSIDETDNVRAKQKLRKVQEEITALQSSETKMTKYDLDYAQKRYELRLAEIALEEAQNAKSQVRMQRNNDGGWSYVYTSDSDATSKAQQNYEDKLYALQDVTQNRINDLQSQLMDNAKKMQEELSKLNQNDSDYQEKKLKITEFYTSQEEYLIKQFQNALSDSADVYEVDWKEYNRLTGYKMSSNEEWVDSWNETILAQITGFQTLEDYYDNFIVSTNTFLSEMNIAYENWQIDIDEAFEAAGTSVEEFGGENGKATKAIKDVQSAVDELIKKFSDEKEGLGAKAKSGFDDMVKAASAAWDNYDGPTDKILKRNQAIVDTLKDWVNWQKQVDSKSGRYFGTYTIDGQTYRTKEDFETEEEAKSAAKNVVTKYLDQVKKDGDKTYYTNSIIQGIENSVGAVDWMTGMQNKMTSTTPEIKKPKNAPTNPNIGIESEGVNPEATNKKYYATFFNEKGEKLTDTSKYYNTEKEAKTAARTSQESYATEMAYKKAYSLANEKGEYHSVSSLYTSILNQVKKAGNVGAVEQDKFGSNREDKWYQYDKDVDNYKFAYLTDIDGNKFVLTDQTYQGVSRKMTEAGYIEDEGKPAENVKFIVSSKLGEYIISFAELKRLNSIMGDTESGSFIQISPSGDLTVDDNKNSAFDENDLINVNNALPYYKDPATNEMFNEIWTPKINEQKAIITDRYWNSKSVIGGPKGIYYQIKGMTSTSAFTHGKKLYVYQDDVVKAFDTGGYTGSWDSTGRLAMLHQKEIVLNAHDTENFLAAVNIVRDIATMIDLKAAAQTAALSAISAMNIAPMTQTIEQDVTIHAEFPNATNHSEIEAAFDTLINRAAQFANRKK